MAGRRRAKGENARVASSVAVEVEIKGTRGAPPRDTTSKLIKEIFYNYMDGNYKADLVHQLRVILQQYDPNSLEKPLIRIVFTPTGNKRNKLEEDRLAAYIDSFSVYLVGFEIKNVIWEFGKYSKTEMPVSAKSEELGQRERNKTMMKKMDKRNSKATKGKKEKKPVDNKVVRVLKGSHLLGFKEGYGDGLAPPGDVKYGRQSLITSIRDICKNFHNPEPGKTATVCFNWCWPLTVVTVMTCEAARFHPVCWYFEKLIKEGEEKELLDWLSYILNQWANMSKKQRDKKTVTPYKGVIPPDYDNLTKEIVKDLCKDHVWITKVLAISWREANEGQKGEGSSKAN